jgi:hypothetical protein
LIGQVVGIATFREDALNVDPTRDVGRVGAGGKKREERQSSREGDDDDRQRMDNNSSAFNCRGQTRES